MALIEIRNLSLSYRLQGQSVAVLKDVNFDIQAGEMVAILGPSGSGKSTLLYILGCLLKPTTGSYRLNNTEVTALQQEASAGFRAQTIGFVFQQFHLLPRANLIENLLLSTRYAADVALGASELRDKAMGLLVSVGMDRHVHHRPNELSGGQQQRVAICRALMNDPPLILADEPTGNLDSKSAAQVLQILRDIQAAGRTVIIVTHDSEVAKSCDRVITVHDGVVTAGPAQTFKTSESSQPRAGIPIGDRPARWQEDLKIAWQNLLRNKSRSFLTMLGVIIGIAAVLSTLTLGTYTQDKILSSYESLGVNKMVVRAYPRWGMAAKDLKGPPYAGVDPKYDILPMRKLFREILLVSPVVSGYVKSAEYGGKTVDELQTLGVSEEYFTITNRRIIAGHPFNAYHVERQSRVCVIGYDIAKRLFGVGSPLNAVVQMSGNNDVSFSCSVIGVLGPQTSNSEWFNPNQQILLPYTYLSLVLNQWNAKPYQLNLTVRPGTSISALGENIKKLFFLKYGRSAQVTVDSDSVLVAQMRTFLTLFTILLSGVALISLAVGGVGIANMMLVSVTERFKEIGLRKALGARDQDIRRQFLIESSILCSLAGIAGIIFGIVGYHTILYFASKVFTQVKFEWVFNGSAILLSLVSIVAVGLLSGLIPALRAQKMEVVEALRSE